jgi:hypothetical protein
MMRPGGDRYLWSFFLCGSTGNLVLVRWRFAEIQGRGTLQISPAHLAQLQGIVVTEKLKSERSCGSDFSRDALAFGFAVLASEL